MKTSSRLFGIIALATIIAFAVIACDNGNDPQSKTYTVTFNSNGGGSVDPQTVAEGGKVTEPQGVAKNRNMLDGWYNGGTKWNFSADAVTSDLELTAKWNLDTGLIASDFDGQNADSIFEVHNTAEWNTAIEAVKAGGDGKNYLINVNNSFAVASSDYLSITFGDVSDIKIAIWGDAELSLSGGSSLLYIGYETLKQTVILRDITLRGSSDNARCLVWVRPNCILKMKGNAAIKNNTCNGIGAGGVYVMGTFIMEGGVISGNTGIHNTSSGGGVALISGSTDPARFVKTGGIIYGYTEDDPLSNVVKDSSGNIVTNRGAALVNLSQSSGGSREKTIGPDQQLEYDGSIWVKWVDDDGVVTNQ